MKKIVVNLIMFLVLIAYIGIMIFLYAQSWNNLILLVSIGLALVYALVVFFIKKLRTMVTLWFGILSLLMGGWWTYLFLQNIG